MTRVCLVPSPLLRRLLVVLHVLSVLLRLALPPRHVSHVVKARARLLQAHQYVRYVSLERVHLHQLVSLERSSVQIVLQEGISVLMDSQRVLHVILVKRSLLQEVRIRTAPGHRSGRLRYDTCADCFFSVLPLAATFCPSCPSGSVTNSVGTVQCATCGVGYYAINDATRCEACPSGSSQSATGQLGCSSCAKGKYTSLPAQPECLDCPASTISASNGATGCTSCLVGTFGSTKGLSTCELCRAGYYQNTNGSLSCQECQSGFFSLDATVTYSYNQSLTGGEVGFDPELYGNATYIIIETTYDVGNEKCMACPSGTVAAGLGSKECTPCDLGYFNADEGELQDANALLLQSSNSHLFCSCVSFNRCRYMYPLWTWSLRQ